MARLKKSTGATLDKATTRLASLKSIDAKMDLGNGQTIEKYEAAIDDLRGKIQDYNTSLSLVDEKLNQIQASEKFLKDLNERMLTGVASKYGKDSDQYEKAGGVKKSDRKRPKRKNKDDNNTK